ncbi:MAG TPA: hypothetical protein VEA16_01780 [Vicinamibacterales bacterium]|nr:hypothetical protein [Vicinamibacterales bacterium]
MMPITTADARALEAVEQKQPFEFPFAARSKVFEVFFPTSADVRDVAHGMGETPDGVLVLTQIGGYVLSATQHLWTRDVALLQASANNTRALVMFFTLRENVVDA